MAEVRTWISVPESSDGLTAGELKAYLDHVPADAFMEDAEGQPLRGVEAIWEVTST